MPELSKVQKDAIIARREGKSGKTGVKHPPSKLEVHHRDRNTKNNDPKNLVLLTIKEHDDLHKRAKK